MPYPRTNHSKMMSKLEKSSLALSSHKIRPICGISFAKCPVFVHFQCLYAAAIVHGQQPVVHASLIEGYMALTTRLTIQLSYVSNCPAFKAGSYPVVSTQCMCRAHAVHQNADSTHFTLVTYLYTVNKSVL